MIDQLHPRILRLGLPKEFTISEELMETSLEVARSFPMLRIPMHNGKGRSKAILCTVSATRRAEERDFGPLSQMHDFTLHYWLGALLDRWGLVQ
jgi:hypothetical protein